MNQREDGLIHRIKQTISATRVPVHSRDGGCIGVQQIPASMVSDALARAILAAIRVPTDGMCNAGSSFPADEFNDENRMVSALTARDVWQAMIDEALKL
jgi:hypothetical protein